MTTSLPMELVFICSLRPQVRSSGISNTAASETNVSWRLVRIRPAAGRGPSIARQREKSPCSRSELSFGAKLHLILSQEDTFEAVAPHWLQTTKAKWIDVHAADVIHNLERDVFSKNRSDADHVNQSAARSFSFL